MCKQVVIGADDDGQQYDSCVCLCVAGRGGGQLPRGGDSIIPAEDDAHPRGLRVLGVHHSVWGHRHPGPVHFARGTKTHKQTKAAVVMLP